MTAFIMKIFVKKNIILYFSKYGQTISCKQLIDREKYLLEFVDYDSVDCAILDIPHYCCEDEVILQKYVEPERFVELGLLQDRIYARVNSESKRHVKHVRKSSQKLLKKIERMKNLIESLHLCQETKLELLQLSYQKQIFPKTEQLNLKMKNFLNVLNEQIII